MLFRSDLAGLGSLPCLVFFNACEAGRVRGQLARGSKLPRAKHPIQESVGLAEAFLRGGVANYLGTYWPVGDAAAEAFATTFYNGLVGGQSIGQALSAGRAKVKDEVRSADWADYIHYGAYDFVLKQA